MGKRRQRLCDACGAFVPRGVPHTCPPKRAAWVYPSRGSSWTGFHQAWDAWTVTAPNVAITNLTTNAWIDPTLSKVIVELARQGRLSFADVRFDYGSDSVQVMAEARLSQQEFRALQLGPDHVDHFVALQDLQEEREDVADPLAERVDELEAKVDEALTLLRLVAAQLDAA